MASWKAVLVGSPQVFADRAVTTVRLSDGTQEIDKPLVITDPNTTDEQLSARVSAMAAALPTKVSHDKLKAYASTLADGREFEVTLPTPPVPVPVDPNLATFLTLLRQERVMSREIYFGVRAADDKTYASVRSAIQGLYVSDYGVFL